MSARDLHGWAEISPAGPIEAGSTGTWRMCFQFMTQATMSTTSSWLTVNRSVVMNCSTRR